MTQQLDRLGRHDVTSTILDWVTGCLVMQRQFMSLVGQYDMDLFTSIFSLLYAPVPGFQLANLLPDEVSPSRSTSSLHACFCASCLSRHSSTCFGMESHCYCNIKRPYRLELCLVHGSWSSISEALSAHVLLPAALCCGGFVSLGMVALSARQYQQFLTRRHLVRVSASHVLMHFEEPTKLCMCRMR